MAEQAVRIEVVAHMIGRDNFRELLLMTCDALRRRVREFMRLLIAVTCFTIEEKMRTE